MQALDHKLIRDLWRLRGQVLAIALVIASGVATLVMALLTIEALRDTSDAYYQRYRFADVFADVTRAPARLAARIESLPGVQTVETRISRYATVDIQGFSEPVLGQLVSVPENSQPSLNQLVLNQGRWLLPGRDNEVILSEPFAQAHELTLGDQVSILMNGSKRRFFIVGLALSPEFIYSLGPGAIMPDDKRFGVMWLSLDVLEAAFDLKESFNNVALALQHNANQQQVLNRLDVLLQDYGGTKAYSRDDQISNWFVMNEIAQQETMATILPGIFISVSVFLTNMVLARLIATERTEIGLLKAFGYSRVQIGWHYSKMVLVITLIGVLFGWLLGMLFGRLNTEMYATLFRFPLLIYQPGYYSFVVGALVSTVAALLGALIAVRSAVKLSPAEAMQPPTPSAYKHNRIAALSLPNGLDQPTRIALRQIGRWPLRSLLTSTGIAFAVALVVMNLQWSDSLNYLARVYFFEAQKQNAMVGFAETKAVSTQFDLAHLPGVLTVEPMRAVSADFSVGQVTHKGSINGISQNSELYPIYDDAQHRAIEVPDNGLAIATKLAEKLRVRVGDQVWVQIHQGRRPAQWLTVTATFDTFIGTPAFMHINQLDKLLLERPSMEYANLLIDPLYQQDLFAELKQTPQVASVMLKQAALESFQTTIIEHLMVFISMFILLASVLAFGVSYNSTRIALSERGRELATLRVLGFTRGEISYVLLGEVMFLILLGLPLGCLFGWLLVAAMADAFDTEMFRIPFVIEPSTYGYAMVIALLASLVSAALVRMRVDKLDLIRVLKTRE